MFGNGRVRDVEPDLKPDLKPLAWVGYGMTRIRVRSRRTHRISGRTTES